MRVPELSTPQVDRHGVPGVATGGVVDTGAGLRQGLGAATQPFLEASQQATRQRVEAAINDLTEKRTALIQDMQGRKPEELLKPLEDGSNPADGYKKQWKNIVEAKAKELGTPFQKEMLQQWADKSAAHIGDTVAGLQVQAQRQLDAATQDGRITTSLITVSKLPYDEAVYKEQKGILEDTVRRKWAGLGEDKLNAELALANSTLLAARIHSLLDNPGGYVKAKELVDNQSDQLVGNDKLLVNKVNERFGEDASYDIAKRVGTSGKLSDAVDAARAAAKSMGVDPKQAESAVTRNYQIAKETKAIQDADVRDKVSDMRYRGQIKTSDIYSVAVRSGMSSTEATHLQKWWEQDDYTRLMRGRALATEKDPNIVKDNITRIAEAMANPEALVRLPITAFDDIRNNSTPQQWHEFVNFRARLLNDPQQFKDAVVDAKQVAVALEANNFIANAGAPTKAEKETITKAQAYVIQQMNNYRSANPGVKITPELRQSFVTQAMQKTIEQKRWFGLSTAHKAPWEVAPDASVPDAFKEAAKKRWPGISADLIAEEYKRNPKLFDKVPTSATTGATAGGELPAGVVMGS